MTTLHKQKGELILMSHGQNTMSLKLNRQRLRKDYQSPQIHPLGLLS